VDRPHILALIPLPDATREALEAHYTLHYAPQGPQDAEYSKSPLAHIAGVVTNGTTGLSGAHIAQLPALRIVCAFGVGHENVDTAAAQARGIVVANAPNTNGETVADHALGFLLALSRGYGALTRAVQQGGWASSRAARPTLHGATLGIIGMGRVGQAIARRGVGFAMQVTYFDRNERSELPYRYVANLMQLARESDYLVAACPGGAATYHLVDSNVLGALGPSGFFVNVARGSVVHTDALVQALQTGAIAGAGLDVLESEPDVPEALRTLSNVLITPHVAGRSPAAQAAQTDALLASLAAFFAGRMPASVVPPA
jgi:lactate dehydrogenase-like 2-hydroxyacid dehydrogenase